MTTFSKRLRQVREERRLTQTDLADKCGLLPSAISHFESGRRTPSLRNFAKLVVALSVKAGYLIDLD